ncbi:MAG: SRPBCC family protein [Pseudobdellovibrionaceae bacterium]
MDKFIELSVTLKASCGWIWNALTDRGELENWWGEKVILEPKVGGTFKEPWDNDDGIPQLASGKVLKVKKENLIVFTWKEKNWPKDSVTICSFIIEDNGKNRSLTVKHEGWETLPDAIRPQLIKDFKIGWNYHLKELRSYLDD